MSKFFAGGLSDSELSSSDEEDLYASSPSEDESGSEEGSDFGSSSGDVGGSGDEGSDSDSDSDKPRAQYTRSKFLKGQASDSSSDSESSDDDRKVVKSAKDKLLDEIDSTAKNLDSAVKQGDWIAAIESFDKLTKSTERADRQYETVPLSFVRSLVELESSVAQRGSKSLSPSQSKAQNSVRQRLKKVQRDFQSRLASYKKDPESYMPGKPLLSETLPRDTKKAVNLAAVAAAPGQVGEAANVFDILMSIVEMRGKKNTDRGEQVAVLENLLKTCTTAYQKISVFLMLIPIRFDLTSSGSIMPLATWKAIDRDIRTLLQVLEDNFDEYMVIESAAEPEDLEKGPEPDKNGIKCIPGSVSALIERLDDEHTRALQVIDPHTTEYIDRLRDETKLYDLFLRVQCYTERNLARLGIDLADSESLCRLIVRRVDHIYYKPTTAIVTTELEAWSRVPESLDSKLTPRLTAIPENQNEYTIKVVNQLCSVLYHQANTAFRARAMLAVIYHYALNDYYYKARDLLLMSHLQSSISSAEPAIQVLFNRALVQVGLCAFRVGLIPEVLQSLQEICSSSRVKELLGQGPSKHSGNPQQDRQQLLPFHMHINLELIECVYLTCSLLIEVPYLASMRNSADLKKKIISKPFRRMLDFHGRQVFNGPSESTRDHIIQAAKALQTGDWKTAKSLLSAIKVWGLLSGTEKTMAMLEGKLQVEGLRTYLFTYGTSYGTLALEHLETMFQLPVSRIRSIVTKMIANDELAAVFDETSNYIVFRPNAELSKLQVLSQALAERALSLAERNERLAGDGHGPDQVKKVSNRKTTRV